MLSIHSGDFEVVFWVVLTSRLALFSLGSYTTDFTIPPPRTKRNFFIVVGNWEVILRTIFESLYYLTPAVASSTFV